MLNKMSPWLQVLEAMSVNRDPPDRLVSLDRKAHVESRVRQVRLGREVKTVYLAQQVKEVHVVNKASPESQVNKPEHRHNIM